MLIIQLLNRLRPLLSAHDHLILILSVHPTTNSTSWLVHHCRAFHGTDLHPADNCSGISASSADDINDDGLVDVISGSSGWAQDGINSTGSSTVLFGNDEIFIDDFEL